jgi:hypothetical protein
MIGKAPRRTRRMTQQFESPWLMPGQVAPHNGMYGRADYVRYRARGVTYIDHGVSPKPGWRFVMLDSGNGHLTVARVRA